MCWYLLSRFFGVLGGGLGHYLYRYLLAAVSLVGRAEYQCAVVYGRNNSEHRGLRSWLSRTFRWCDILHLHMKGLEKTQNVHEYIQQDRYYSQQGIYTN